MTLNQQVLRLVGSVTSDSLNEIYNQSKSSTPEEKGLHTDS